jgi:hypothetical protein
MRRRHRPAVEPSEETIDAALAALDAEELREVARELLLELDDRAHRRVVSAIINRAARGGSGWTPPAPGSADVAEAVAFARAARRVGHADPGDVDERLRRGTAAFLRKDYPAAHRIFGALLRPLAEAEIDVGQHEMLDEVMGVDANECAVQYVVSAYMTADASRRAEAVRTAIDEVRGAGSFFMPCGRWSAPPSNHYPDSTSSSCNGGPSSRRRRRPSDRACGIGRRTDGSVK